MISNISGHSPLPSNVHIAPSPIHGMGIFASKPIEKNYDFGITHVYDKRFDNSYIRTPFGGFINHSFSPNCVVFESEDTLHIKTIKSVAQNEELTLDYRPYYTEVELSKYV